VSGVLGTVFGFPTVAFTVLLIVSLAYWLFVLVGAVDLDGSDGAAEGLAGATKGAAEGAMEGGIKGALEAKTGAADGALDHAHDAIDLDVPDAGLLASLVSALRLRSAPFTVVFSLFALFGWLASALTMTSFGNALPFPTWMTGIPVFFGSAILALLVTSVAIRPLAPIFATRHAKTHNDVIGRVVVVSTGSVDEKFGQATLEDGGAGLILQVRADPKVGLRRGDRCLVVDVEGGSFRIEKMTDVLADPGASFNVQAQREAQAEVEAALSNEQAAAEADAARRRAQG
jgi:hypothetical protein